MTKTILALALVALTAAPAMAQWTSNRVGPYTYYNGPDGWSGHSNSVGPYTYHNFTGPQGQNMNCSSNTVGGYTYTNCY